MEHVLKLPFIQTVKMTIKYKHIKERLVTVIDFKIIKRLVMASAQKSSKFKSIRA